MKSIKGIKNPHLNFWANFLLSLGFISLIIFGYLVFQRYNPQKLAFNIDETSAFKNLSTSEINPVGLKIDSINLVLPITESEIKDNKWQASTTSVSYLKTSPIPGQKGNSILYGHNWPNLLGNLKNTGPGDTINIIYSDNSRRDFEIDYKTQVDPNQTLILENSEDNRITLYTCTGFLDTQRLVVVAKLLKT